MSNTYLGGRAECPFYMSDEPASRYAKASITCEGIYGRATKTLFNKQSDKDAHGEQFCTSVHRCKNCEIYKLVNKKYKK